MLKIIDNKKVQLTQDEFMMYESICKNYKQGKDLFRNLFETDDDGIIVFLRPPEKTFSMEVVIFLQNLMVHQHLRKIYAEHQQAMNELNQLMGDVRKGNSSNNEVEK